VPAHVVGVFRIGIQFRRAGTHAGTPVVKPVGTTQGCSVIGANTGLSAEYMSGDVVRHATETRAMFAEGGLLGSSRHVVLGGGAMYGLMFVGALRTLCNNDPKSYAAWYARVTDVAGTSMGAIVGFLLVAGLDPWAMQALAVAVNLARVLDDVGDVDLMSKCALASGNAIVATAKQLVLDVTGSADTTFAQLHARTKRRFVVVVTNGATGLTEYWDHVTRGTMPIATALRCTASIPGVFVTPVIDGAPIFDGGITCNVACHMFPPSATLTLFVSSGQCVRQSPGWRGVLTQVYELYSNAAQLGPMRALPVLAFRAVPCCMLQTIGPLGAFSFDADTAAVDALVQAGARSVAAVLCRDLCLVTVALLKHAASGCCFAPAALSGQ
jgi:predicted acylesterase/phospholipase RssA